MSEESEVVSRFKITGRVQGVGFRWFTEKAAQEIGLRGWVKNCADGSVESVAAGSPGQLERFERELGRGPSSSRVDDVERSDTPDTTLGESFDIVY